MKMIVNIEPAKLYNSEQLESMVNSINEAIKDGATLILTRQVKRRKQKAPRLPVSKQ